MATLSTPNFLFCTNKKCCLNNNNNKKNSVRAAFCFDSFTPLWKCMCSLWKWELKSMFITSKQIYGLHYDKAKKLFLSFFFSGLGFANFMASCFVGLYYNMIIAWTIYYFFASFTSHLPWDSCNNDFNTECKFQNHFLYLFI